MVTFVLPFKEEQSHLRVSGVKIANIPRSAKPALVFTTKDAS